MLIVYVKHYLTDKGIQYFKSQWFPKVGTLIGQQEGFISITYSLNQKENDCVDITLKFRDEKALKAWVAVPAHDALIKALNQHRSRDYWEAVKTEDTEINPSLLEWTRYFLVEKIKSQ